jgi:hypothetical protein
MVGAARNPDAERRPLVEPARDRHTAAVEVDELLDQGETYPGALVAPRAGALDPVESLEEPRQLARRDPRPGVAHLELDVLLVQPYPNRDRAGEGELDRVREEIEDNLLPHVAVDVDGLRQRGAIDDERQASSLDRGAKAARELRRQHREIERLVDRLDAAGLDSRELEQRVDELEQAQRVAVEEVDRLGRDGSPGRRRPQILDRREHEGQRRAELVAHVAEEGGLGAIELGKRLGAPALGLVGARVADGGRDLVRDQAEKPPIPVVEAAARAHPGDEEPVGLIGPGACNGQDERGWGRIWPGTGGDAGPDGRQLGHLLGETARSDLVKGPLRDPRAHLVALPSGGRHELRLASSRIESVEKRKWQIVHVVAERLRRFPPG